MTRSGGGVSSVRKAGNAGVISAGRARIGEDRHVCVPWSLAILAILFVASPAFADGIDVGAYIFTWIPGEHSIAVIAGLVVLLMGVNYVLNFVVIGIPAINAGTASELTVSVDLIFLTLLGQVADRLGEIAAVLVSLPLVYLISLLLSSTSLEGGLAILALTLLVLYPLCSGLAIYVLAMFFLERRWQVRKPTARLIAGIASVVTNPVWLMALGSFL